MKWSLLLLLTLITFCAQSQLIQYQVLPSATDASITTFTDASQKHVVFLNKSVAKKNQLFIFLPGTGGNPANVQRIDSLAANLGYHAIGLMYPNDPAIGSLCSAGNDVECYTNTRMEIIDGTDRTTLVAVDRANSIENRIIKLVQYLQLQTPGENWSQFLTNGTINWEKVVIAGHSQGGGHAGLISKNHKVARVLFFAAPKDYSAYFSAPANWINTTNETPANRYFAFTHSADEFGCTFIQQQTIYTNLGMAQFGAAVNTDNILSPYTNSHILTSTRTVSSSLNAHNSVVVDTNVPLDNNSIPYYRPTWVYMMSSDLSSGTITGLENSEAVTISVYPNPATNVLTVKNANQNSFVTIYDISGKQILSGNLLNQEVDVSALPNGFYTLKIESDKGRVVDKFIKQ